MKVLRVQVAKSACAKGSHTGKSQNKQREHVVTVKVPAKVARTNMLKWLGFPKKLKEYVVDQANE